MDTNVYYDVVGFQCLDRIDHQTNDLYLTRCGIHKCPLNHSWGPKKRPQYHMHFILEGQGYLKINNNTYHLKQGQIFLIPPNTISHYYVDNDDPWTYAFISFQGNKADQYVRQAGFKPDCFIRDCVLPVDDYASLVSEMLETHQLTITNELRRVSLLFALFSLLTSSNQQVSEHSHTDKDYLPETYFEYALQYIQLNYNHNIRVQDIADYIGITRSYLFHLFNQKLKISPQKYLLNFRIEQARILLSTTDLFIKDVAASVGYEDSLAFSKMFHNATGCSPSTYRKHSKASAEN